MLSALSNCIAVAADMVPAQKMEVLARRQHGIGSSARCEVAGAIGAGMPYCRTSDPRRLPAVPNRGRKWPPCRLTADRRRWFGESLVTMEWLTPMATRLSERWRIPSLAAIGLTLRAPPFA
jgi:hypothetical protein